MYKNEEIDDLLDRICEKITINEEMFNLVTKEYTDLGRWIGEKTPNMKMRIFPQGSFALGTVIKPISENDDYDIDLVCELDRDYGLIAEVYKKEVSFKWLTQYKKHEKDLEDKHRCWHVEYDDIKNFHMDVVPAYNHGVLGIKITEKIDGPYGSTYRYINSNPEGYIAWFFEINKKSSARLYESYAKRNGVRVNDSAEIDKIKRNKIKTTLQKAIILLKRHRDIMFKDNPDDKPISIIITTLAALCYEDTDSISKVLTKFFDFAPAYLKSHCYNGVYYVTNPVDSSDNFANKWEEKPERREAFLKWLGQASNDLNVNRMLQKDRTALGQYLKTVLGEGVVRKVYDEAASKDREAIRSGDLKVDASRGMLSKLGSVAIPLNHHYHEE